MSRFLFALIAIVLCGLAVQYFGLNTVTKENGAPPATDNVWSTPYDIDFESSESVEGVYWWFPCANEGHVHIDLGGDYVVVVPHSP